jgi:hypothetical protein
MARAVKQRSVKDILEGLLEQRPIPKGVGFDKCVDRMSRASGVDDPEALCAWMWDEETGFFASAEQECGGECEQCEAKKAAMARADEAVTSTSQAQVLRPQSKRKVESLVSLAEAVVDRKTRSVRCVVIREGGGNRRDRHWYGPEAIGKIAQLINGAKAHVNHPTEAEARARPEGDLWSLAGFWKDGEVVEANGAGAVMATLVCDTSEAGEAVLSKEFPTLEEVYAGISINGDGDTEPREINGEDWNYVVDVTELPRADVVTRPAREGKFLALVESIRSANPKEAREMANKAVKGELTKIAEATAALDEEQDPKKSVGVIEAAVAKLKALFKEAFPPKKDDDSEDETEDEAKKKASEKCEDETEDESEDESEDEAMRADDAVDGKDGDDEDDEEEPADKKGSKSVVHIKHEERRTQSEAAAEIRKLEKQLKETQAENAKLTKRMAAIEVKELVEAGLPEDFAKALQDLPAPQRKAMRSLASMIESNSGGFAGATARGTSAKESKPGDGFMKLLESDGGRS